MFSRTTPAYSKDTQDLLKVMMEESKLTLFQQRQIKDKLKSGSSLPTTVNPTSSKSTVSKAKLPRQSKSKLYSKRSKDVIERLQSEDTETELLPRPCKPGRDTKLEKEKLQNIMAFGDALHEDKFSDQIKALRRETCDSDDVTIDKFDEVMDEIRERQDFLNCVNKHGADREVQHKILTEISQRVREIKQIDKTRAGIALTEIISSLK
ncbi:hypothetical protein LOD99_13998 [Oopsacas minuta]|uniref:Uncharacterized protein n=1 Tax=Oopsacas minuta TaxID=111878 RepID=A0AAV7KGH6_9METZ|nr:hypothetical protein LOD99_13998 [Oopsacas minuta]